MCLHACTCQPKESQWVAEEEYLTTEGQHHDYSQVEGTGKGGREGEREGREMREINT